MPDSTSTRLSQLQPGDAATIAGLHAEENLHHRLAALGFRVGKRIEVIRRASFSGPLHVRIGATDVMLRRVDAHRISIHLS